MPHQLHLVLDRLPTPIGQMILVASHDGKLRLLFFAENDDPIHRHLAYRYGIGKFDLQLERNPHGLTEALARYFAGDLHAINDLQVDTGGTPFQQEVWSALRTIPCGETTSYGKLAAQIGHPDAVRAVGAANGANPVAVVVPCHRVIGSNGSLTGYGGGIERKRWLLNHEKTPTLF